MFFDLPYNKRKLVIFYDEDSDRQVEKAKATINKGRIVPGVIPFSKIPAIVVVTSKMVEQWKQRGLGLQFVNQSDASYFVLPPGHPYEQVVYAGHPLLPTNYSPFSEFHRLTFQHKFTELVSLLRHLGSKSIQAEHREGWDASVSANLGVDSGAPGVEVKAEAGVRRNRNQQIVFSEISNNNREPTIPGNLVWYPHEPTWQTIAEGRLKFGTQRFSLDFQYKNDYGVDAKLASRVQRLGLSIGGESTEYENTVWHIEGTF